MVCGRIAWWPSGVECLVTGAWRTLGPHGALLALGAWLAWRPAESHPWSAAVTAGIVLALCAWGWRRTPAATARRLAFIAAAAVLILAAGLSGWDPASAVSEVGLLVAVLGLAWLASRELPPERFPELFAVFISGLALWGLWQVVFGLEEATSMVADLPEPMQFAAAERLASGRAFASQILPSHLAVLLATALPLVVVRIRWRWSAAPWIAASILCVVGLILTRSPVGIGLAVAACTALALAHRKARMVVVALALAATLVAVVLWRGDVRQLEPVGLRLDNWRTALWEWSTAPAVGVGPGGFAQAAQSVPFRVGNRPRHAHSLPLEWLAELGPAGLIVCLAMAVALWRLARDLWPDRPELAVAVVVIPAHNLVDFSLYSSGVALPWAVLVGWAIAERGPATHVEAAPRGRIGLVVVAALVLALSVLHATSRTVGDAAAVGTSPEVQMAGALTARRLAPWRVEPLGPAASAALRSGNPAQVSEVAEELDRARWLRPRSAALAHMRARLSAALGEGPTALSEAWTASRAQPSNAEYEEYFDGVLRELEKGPAGEDG